MFHSSSTQDPTWPVTIQRGTGVLWIGQGFKSELPPAELPEAVETLLTQPWKAVFIDANGLPIEEVAAKHTDPRQRILRVFSEAPPQEDLAPNRLPIYLLRGAGGSSPGTDDPLATLNRLTMLQRAPAGCELFAVGIREPGDVAGLLEAQRVSPAFHRLVVQAPEALSRTVADILEPTSDRLVHWLAGFEDFRNLLTEARASASPTAVARVLIRSAAATQHVDLSACVDPGYPITSAFELIPASEVLAERTAAVEDVEVFLADPSAGWHAYSTGIPYPRHQTYEAKLHRLVQRFRHEGASASCTAWIPAEEASGATTILRQICFNMAREGVPVLVARPHCMRFDFRQVASFLEKASGRIENAGVLSAELPWVIAFDTEHAQLHWEFIVGLANGLKKLLRPVIVLVVHPVSLINSARRDRALGTNHVLGDALENTLSHEDASELGRHLNKFLPPSLHRGAAEWYSFISESTRTTMEGKRSLFWVALRFWLFRVPGAETSLRQWLTEKVTAAAKRASIWRGVLDCAILTKYRLILPSTILDPLVARDLSTAIEEGLNGIGFRILRTNAGLGFTVAHPMMAEELLRIAGGHDQALSEIGHKQCIGLMDLELHLLAGIVSRKAAGKPEIIPIIEELVTNALRVDPRESPRNYSCRDRIVALLESAPDSLWDESQVFLHHLAKARRHLAVDPPDDRWSLDARREQLELAENHLLDAIKYVRPRDPERQEKPLNLQVSLALTYDARARIEALDGKLELVEKYEKLAESAYQVSQQIDADNSYVLENYARFKLRQARKLEPGSERTTLICDAIAMLDWERQNDEAGRRDEVTLIESASAYEMLEENNGFALLRGLAEQGSEPALVGLAQLSLRKNADAAAAAEAAQEAEQYLRQVEPAIATWRSRFALYRVVKSLRPHDIAERLSLLSELAAMPEFAWPQQTRLEYAILLFQVGDPQTRRRGKEVFQQVREELASRTASVYIPPELRFLMDPQKGFRERLATSIVVKSISEVGRTCYGIPSGWGTVDVAFRAYRFTKGNIRPRDELDCYIQFTNFGPQAVPLTEA